MSKQVTINITASQKRHLARARYAMPNAYTGSVFGQQIRCWRFAHRVTQRELARALGCTGSYISAVERGTVIPSPAIEKGIRQALSL